MNAPPAAGRESRPAGNQGRREFLALMAAASATVAISIDVMLPAFGELREYLGLPSDSSSVALVVTVFLIVPTLAPILGQTLLSFGSWRYTFAVGPVFGMLVALWSTRLTETLKPGDRRPINLRSLAKTVGEILMTRKTIGNAIALRVMSAAFLPYLGSSERMYGEIYDHGDTFFLFFAGSAVVMAGFTLASALLVRLIGTRRTMAGVFTVLVVAATLNLLVTTASDGVPAFAFFFLATTVLISLQTSLSPLLTSGALDEVGHAAGTAASTIGVISLVGGALLSPFVDSAIDLTVTPFAAGFFGFSLVAALAAGWANTGRSVARVV